MSGLERPLDSLRVTAALPNYIHAPLYVLLGPENVIIIKTHPQFLHSIIYLLNQNRRDGICRRPIHKKRKDTTSYWLPPNININTNTNTKLRRHNTTSLVLSSILYIEGRLFLHYRLEAGPRIQPRQPQPNQASKQRTHKAKNAWIGLDWIFFLSCMLKCINCIP